MNGQWTNNPENQNAGGDTGKTALDAALRDFRASVHAWSDAACHGPRLAEIPAARTAPRHVIARRSVAWALGLVLVAGAATEGVHDRHRRQELARQAHQREVEQQRLLAEQHAREVDDLLARVDNDISREVPSAMEPLAQLMAEDTSQ